MAEPTLEKLKAELKDANKRVNSLLWQTLLTFALKATLAIYAIFIVGAIVFRPLGKLVNWLWHLY